MRIAIIGGGIAGVSAAAALSPFGEVVVFEAESALGTHASGRSAAMYVENYGNEAVCTLTRAARAYHEAEGVLSPRGVMTVGFEADADTFDADIAEMAFQEISVEQARARVPILSPDLTRAAVYEDVLEIDTDRLIQGFHRRARANGATFLTNAKVSHVERGDTWRIRAGDHEVTVDIVVNAAGAWADQVACLAGVAPVGLQPYRRSMARLPAPGGYDTRSWPMVFGPGESWYAKPDAGGWIVSPADEDPSEPMDAWADDMVLAEGLARYEAYVTEPVTRVETSWAGLRTFAPDRSLVIGEAPDAPGFYWLAGQGGYGMQTAPSATAMLAALVKGKEPDLPGAVVQALLAGRFMGDQAKSGV
ncbi:MAG: FAD-binding oxidoreductase [Silicimonas sp.]|nr:FAD-binding oxidoreductase [Silicimonas sp.]